MAKENNPSLAQKRALIKTAVTKQFFKMIKTLECIAIKSKENPTAKFQRLFHVISDEGILTQAMGTVMKKKGALTKGPTTEPSTADEASLNTIKSISKHLKEGTFKFKPVRRI